ncbi:MAG: MATE family efflux transporter [Bacteroidales bacterium]
MALNKQERALADAPIGRLFFRYSIPTVLGLLIFGLQGIIDGLFVGNFIGAEALAAVNVAMPVYSTVIAITLVFGIGAITLISTALGKQDYQAANNALRTAFISLMVITAIITLGLLTNMQWVITFLGANEQMRPLVEDYFWGLAPFFILAVTVFLGDFALKASGQPVTSTTILLGVISCNIALDYLFIAHLQWGVWGAGLATGVSYTLGAMVYLSILLSKSSNVTLRCGRFNWRILAPMTYNGLSEGIADASKVLVIFILNHAMINVFGAEGVAALTVINYIQYVGITIYLGISDGIVPIISYNYGANQPNRMCAVVHYGLAVNMISGLSFFTILFFFATDIARLFFDDNTVSAQLFEIVDYGAKIMACAFLFNGANILMSATFTAIHDATKSILVATSRGVIFMLIGVVTIISLWGDQYIWFAIPCAEFITLIIFAPIFLRRIKPERLNP